MSSDTGHNGLFEKALRLNSKFDKASIVGGAAVGLFFNPVLGGAIIGGSLISMEAGRRIGYEVDKSRRRSRKLGATATVDTLSR